LLNFTASFTDCAPNELFLVSRKDNFFLLKEMQGLIREKK